MRPITLEVSGFTSFRERAVVDFTGLGLFAITGQTGAGKTSLLDAITWALYGKTARLQKAGRELISQGANAMDVLLRFRAGTHEYRVLRRLKSASASATVRLEHLEEGEWLPVTGNVRELDEQIRLIVGLDFEGFNKAVVLPQGEFDVFLRGTPQERREVLAELLDVSVYQRMMQSAGDKSRVQAELARQKGTEVDDSVSSESIAALQVDADAARAEEKLLAAAVKKFDAAYEEAVGLAGLRKQLGTGESGLLDLSKRVAEVERRRSGAVDSVGSLRKSVDDLQRQLETVSYDSDEHLRLAGVLPALQARERLRTSLAASENALQSLLAQIADARRREDESARQAKEAAEAEEEARAVYEALQAADRVTALRLELTPGCACPVCEQIVTVVPAVVDGKKLAAAKKTFEKKSGESEAARKKAEKVRADGERAAREAAGAEGQVASLKKQLAESGDSAESLADVQARVGALQAAKGRRDELNRALESARGKLRDNELLVVSLRAEAEGLLKQIQERRGAVETLRREIEKAASKIRKQLPELSGESESDWIRMRRKEALGAQELARARVVQIEASMSRLREKLARNEQLRREIAVHQREAAEYKELAVWLNAGNFQQFLLDSALQRLGDEGSRHLEKLSAGRYRFAFRDKEFLVRDGWHGDEERSVSTLSGGESFLASLSLALALAEGIAQLNSASGRVVLESLFLDEGFSTLDGETLASVSDALMMLQSGDRLIGIITHVTGLVDQMPARIEVEKTVAGSRIWQEARGRAANL
ncbi:MAG: SMC family ATPase [Bryobacteraceae bacterium]|nr:SMC family ATPase [Bryobacteraceae bacterium]